MIRRWGERNALHFRALLDMLDIVMREMHADVPSVRRNLLDCFRRDGQKSVQVSKGQLCRFASTRAEIKLKKGTLKLKLPIERTYINKRIQCIVVDQLVRA